MTKQDKTTSKAAGFVAVVGVNLPDGDGEARIEPGEKIPVKLLTDEARDALLAVGAISSTATGTISTSEDGGAA